MDVPQRPDRESVASPGGRPHRDHTTEVLDVSYRLFLLLAFCFSMIPVMKYPVLYPLPLGLLQVLPAPSCKVAGGPGVS